MSDPVNFIWMFVVAVGFVGWLIWLVRGLIGRERVAALKERLDQAKEKQEDLAKQLETLKSETASQQVLIEQLKTSFTPAKLENLSTGSIAVVKTVRDMRMTTESLGATLTFSGTGFRLLVEPKE